MIPIDRKDEAYLATQIIRGDALLVLGAGASAGSKNRFGKSVKSGAELAKTFCKNAGLPFQNEPLPTVYEAIRGQRLSDVQIQAILKREYCDTTPSPEL